MATTNLRESLYQCLQTTVNLDTTGDKSTVCLFKVPKTAIFTIKCYLELDSAFTFTVDDVATTKQYNSFIQISFSNGTVHTGTTDADIVPFYKLDQCHLEHDTTSTIQNSITLSAIKDSDANISSITFFRSEKSDEANVYCYYAEIEYRTGSDKSNITSRKLIVRKELVYGDFTELLSYQLDSDNISAYTTNRQNKKIAQFTETTNDVSNGKYVDAENVIFVSNIYAKDYLYTEPDSGDFQNYEIPTDSSAYVSTLRGFKKVTSYDIMANNKLSVGKRYLGSTSGKTDIVYFSVNEYGNTDIQGTLNVVGDTSVKKFTATGDSVLKKTTSTNVITPKLEVVSSTATVATASLPHGTIIYGSDKSTKLVYFDNNIIKGSIVSTKAAAFEPSQTVLNLVREADLYYYQGTENIIKVGTITTGVWEGTKVDNDHICDAFTGKTYNDVKISTSDTTDAASVSALIVDKKYKLADASTHDVDTDVTVYSTNLPTSNAVYQEVKSVRDNLGDQVTYAFNNGVLTISVHKKKYVFND